MNKVLNKMMRCHFRSNLINSVANTTLYLPISSKIYIEQMKNVKSFENNSNLNTKSIAWAPLVQVLLSQLVVFTIEVHNWLDIITPSPTIHINQTTKNTEICQSYHLLINSFLSIASTVNVYPLSYLILVWSSSNRKVSSEQKNQPYT